MNTLHIAAIAYAIVAGQPVVTLTFVSPVAGTAFADAAPLGSKAWSDTGMSNRPCQAGTNTIQVAMKSLPYKNAAQFRIKVQQ